MRMTRKRANALYEVLEAEMDRVSEEPDDRPDRIDGVPVTTLWERERTQVIDRLRRLPTLVSEAAAELEMVHKQGRPPKLTPEQKTSWFCMQDLPSEVTGAWKHC